MFGLLAAEIAQPMDRTVSGEHRGDKRDGIFTFPSMASRLPLASASSHWRCWQLRSSRVTSVTSWAPGVGFTL